MLPPIEKFLCTVQGLLPQRALTAAMHRLTRSEIPWLKNALITVIGSAAGVDWSEAASMELDDYPSFNAFFTRPLRAGVRVIEPAPDALVSPCDGRISEHGDLQSLQLLQAKGQSYSLADLLAGDPACAALADGHFWTIYLSPRDYHRVHMPVNASLQRMIHVPGELYSVSPYTVRQVPRLFARNERVVSIFDTAFGPMALVLVGAMLVASMDTVWAGTITPEARSTISRHDYAPGEVVLGRGAEMGRFNMGSTVILVIPRGAARAVLPAQTGQALRMGERLASLNHRD